MSSKYGHFEAEGAEYVIVRPDTPRPWINYLTNGDYCALSSHVGGGFSFYKDHRLNSVLRRGQHQHVEDLPGRLVYIKDEDTGEVWTANVHPFGKYDSFEARHGMGYTRIHSSYSGIGSSLRFFVPPGIDAELWEIDLTNNGDGSRRLSVYSFADFVLGNVSLEELETTFMALFNEVELGEQEMIFRKKWWHPRYGWSEENGIWSERAFVTTTQRPHKILTDRNVFFGSFRGFTNPAAIELAELPGCFPQGNRWWLSASGR